MPVHKGGGKADRNNCPPQNLILMGLMVTSGCIGVAVIRHLVRVSTVSSAAISLGQIQDHFWPTWPKKGEKVQVEVCYLNFQKTFYSVNHRLLLSN